MDAAPPLLSLTKLEVAYGGIQAVKGIDLHVDQGELVCLIGANGAGKTTTLKGICGLLPVKAGKIRYAGADVTGKPAFQLVRRGLAMVPEGRGVFGALTIEENLAMGAYVRSDAAGIRSDIERVYGLFPRLKERRRQTAGTLSGGEQQMLAMGRAMLSRPKLLLLDEPSMGLAPLMVQKVFETIVTISGEGVTILLIEQNAKLALEVSRRGYVMESGEITIAGDVRIAAARPEGARRVSRRDGVAGPPAAAQALQPNPPAADSPSRAPRAVPPARALAWYAEAMRLWKRGPGTFCGIAFVVLVASVALEPVPVAGFVSANIVAPLLACGLLYASLAADRGDRPRLAHVLAVFAAPLAAQVAVVTAGLVPVAAEVWIASQVAGVNLALPLQDASRLSAGAVVTIYAVGIAVSLPVTFVPMAALFDGEPFGRAFALSARAFALNVPALAVYACIAFALLLVGIATSGIALVLVLPWIASASYAAWKDVFGVK